MRKHLTVSLIVSALAVSACSDKAATTQTKSDNTSDISPSVNIKTDNVLLEQSPLPYHSPQFDKLTVTDYEPAFAQGIQQHTNEINHIVASTNKPTFANTILAMEKSGVLLNRVATVFFGLSGIISNDEYQRIEGEMAPKLSAHNDSILLNETLFARVKAVYDAKDTLNTEDQRLTEDYYNDFVRAGANLSDADKQAIRGYNEEISKLQTQFSQNILASFKNDTIIVKDKAQLSGLSEGTIAGLESAAKKAGENGYLISLVNTTRQPILTNLHNRTLREKIWTTSAHRAKDVNDPIILKLTKLRARKANILGFSDWASYQIDDQMAKTPLAVFKILDDLALKALSRAKQEAADIENVMHKNGVKGSVQPWDWAYYSEQVRKQQFDLDESQIKPYFELNSVLENGLFFAMNKLYGITFEERHDIPLYVDDARVFEVFNDDGSSIGLFFFDPYAREGKAGGAWMSEWVSQSFLYDNKPVIYNELNIVKPASGEPTLLSYDETSTLFHEFGHAAHGLFSSVKYPSVAGTSTPRDFVEFPSQFNEDWAIKPEVIQNYAKHYKTGEAIPSELLEKVLDAVKFNQGFNTVEYLASALLDMEWHNISADTHIENVDAFEKQALAKHGLDYTPVPPRYKSAYFSHTFAGGYSAGYYAYLWTEVLAADAFAYMQDKGGLTRENGDKFRLDILSKGSSEDLMENYVEFRGQQPTVDALLKRKGLDN